MEIGRSVTVAATAGALLVRRPAITSVIRLDTGEVLVARDLVEGLTHEAAVKWRNQIREALYAKTPRLICGQCPTPVYLVCHTDKAFFFRHIHEDGSCAAITRSVLTPEEIRARQYQGLRESEPHLRLKGLIESSLSVDPAFAQIAVEQTWRGELGWRRPDVSARLADLGVAFEGQLSTTFLSVVAARRAFYRQAGGLLVWVLASFDPDHRRMTEDDIVFPNNSNVLVVDDITLAASRAQGRFVVDCWYRVPRATGSGHQEAWAKRTVPFADLTLDVPGQRAFLVDVEEIEAAARASAKAQAAQAVEHERQTLRADFLVYLEDDAGLGDYDEQLRAWAAFEARFWRAGVGISPSWRRRGQLQRWGRVVRTALSGEVFGWGLTNLPQVAHHLHDQHPGLLFAFGRLLKQAGHDWVLRTQDHTGKWRDKAARIRALDKTGRQRFKFDADDLDTVVFLFPEAADTLRKMLAEQIDDELVRLAP